MSDLTALRTPEALLAYAAEQEDQLTDADPAAHTWLLVEQLPVTSVGDGVAQWTAFWEEVEAEGEERGLSMWADLPAAVQSGVTPPIVVALVADAQGGEAWTNVWDGQHRLGAAAVSDVVTVTAVIGLPQDLPWAQVPTAWQALPEVHAHFHPTPSRAPIPERRRLR